MYNLYLEDIPVQLVTKADGREMEVWKGAKKKYSIKTSDFSAFVLDFFPRIMDTCRTCV